MNNVNKTEIKGCGYKECKRCYWSDKCKPSDLDDKDDVITQKCEYYTPLNDYELGIKEYKKDLKMRHSVYKEIVKELNN